MPEQEYDLITLLKKHRLDLDAMRARTSEMIRLVADLDLPDPTEHKCPKCSLTFRGGLALAEHVYISHEGPVPPHWERAEELADA